LKSSFNSKRQIIENHRRELVHAETNFMRYARYDVSLATSLSQVYLDAPLEIEQKPVGLIFPDTLILMYEHGEYGTTMLSEVPGVVSGKSDGIQ
jgi:hypothetical protein